MQFMIITITGAYILVPNTRFRASQIDLHLQR